MVNVKSVFKKKKKNKKNKEKHSHTNCTNCCTDSTVIIVWKTRIACIPNMRFKEVMLEQETK